MNFSDICSLIAFLAYGVATSAMLLRLFHPKGPNLIFVLFFGCVAMVLHTLSNAQFLVAQADINFALPNVISLVSLIICLSISAFALRFKVNLLLPVIYGFAGIWQLLMLFMPNIADAPMVSHEFGVISHVTFALLSYCILVIATLYAFQVAYIHFKLKTKNLTAVSHLPPLMQVEGQLFIILAIGTSFLLLSEVIGFIFLDGMISNENAHKTILSIMAFIVYSVTLLGHYKLGWRGHRVLILTVTGSALLTLAYFGSRFVKEFILL